jgi:5-methylcytosine-specific restriction endonuclease McrA
MKQYVKTYLTYFGYDVSDWIQCEVCGAKAVDIHHLDPRSTNKAKINLIDNLVALCRTCHDKCGSSWDFNEMTRLIHRKKLLSVKTDHEIKRYL